MRHRPCESGPLTTTFLFFLGSLFGVPSGASSVVSGFITCYTTYVCSMLFFDIPPIFPSVPHWKNTTSTTTRCSVGHGNVEPFRTARRVGTSTIPPIDRPNKTRLRGRKTETPQKTVLGLDADDVMSGKANVPREQRLTISIVLDISPALGQV